MAYMNVESKKNENGVMIYFCKCSNCNTVYIEDTDKFDIPMLTTEMVDKGWVAFRDSTTQTFKNLCPKCVKKQMDEAFEENYGKGKDFYNEYMHSEEWKIVKRNLFRFNGYRCQLCGSAKNLEAHHITYDNLGHEDIQNDLLCVCKTCHDNLHFRDNQMAKANEKTN